MCTTSRSPDNCPLLLQDDSSSATVAALGNFNHGGLRRISDDILPSLTSGPSAGPTGLVTNGRVPEALPPPASGGLARPPTSQLAPTLTEPLACTPESTARRAH